MRRGPITAVTVLVLIAGLCGGWIVSSMLNPQGPATVSVEIPGFLWPDPPAVKDFTLRDHQGRTFDRERLLGRWSLLYFGYTHCPDACPTSLSVMREVEKLLLANPGFRDRFQGVFVSVDPARDSLEHLGQYVTHFSPRFIGATASEDSMAKTARDFGVMFQLTEPDEHGSYLVDHTSSFLLVDPQGRLVAVLRTPHEAADLAARISRIERVVAG